MVYYIFLIFFINFISGDKDLVRNQQIIAPEISLDLRIKICSHERNPLQNDVMLYFPEIVRFCASLHTNKNKRLLDREKQKTTFIEPKVVIKFQAINSTNQCSITFTGYQTEYRFSPDLGYYSACQKSISRYISSLVDNESSVWTLTNHLCPIQDLPKTIEDYMACDLLTHNWYQLSFHSSIRYETYKNKLYQKHFSNYTANYIFKPDFVVHRNGNETEWLKTLIDFKTIHENCEIVKYLVKIDKDWPLLIKANFEYRIKDNEKVKYFKKVANGTIKHWYSGEFKMIKDNLKHELCIQFFWKGSPTKYRLCQIIGDYNECPPLLLTSSSYKIRKNNFYCITIIILIFISRVMINH